MLINVASGVQCGDYESLLAEPSDGVDAGGRD